MRVNRGYAKTVLQTRGLSANGAEELMNGRNPSNSVDQHISNGEKFKSRLDSTNEMSEELSLRMQMIMERRSKFHSTLSNLMKKASDTGRAMTQNLK